MQAFEMFSLRVPLRAPQEILSRVPVEGNIGNQPCFSGNMYRPKRRINGV